MNNISILVIGWLLGQAAVNTIEAWKLQKGNPLLTFPEALKLLFYRQGASHTFGVSMLFIAMFVMPEFLKNVIELDDTAKTPKWAGRVVTWIRLSSVGFGAICQYIGLLAFGKLKKGAAAIMDSKSEQNEKTE